MQYLAQMAHVLRRIIEQLKCLHKKFLWNNRLPKIKHSTLIGEYYDGGLKDIDIEAKFKALKLTWIKRLCDDSDHLWKIIPTKFLKLPNRNLISHRNFSLDQTALSKIQGIPVFYVDLLRYWSEFVKFESDDYQILLSESLWFNHLIKIGERPIFLKTLVKLVSILWGMFLIWMVPFVTWKS